MEDMADFNWVKARAACSLEVLFRQLQVAVERDVDIANALNVGSGAKFAVSIHGDRFVVTRQQEDEGVSAVKVVLGKTRLVVTTDAGIKFEATPVLNVEGACKLVVNDSELDLWQVCRRALEDLFFE